MNAVAGLTDNGAAAEPSAVGVGPGPPAPNAARPRIAVKSASRLNNLFGPAPACVDVVTPADKGTSGASQRTGSPPPRSDTLHQSRKNAVAGPSDNGAAAEPSVVGVGPGPPAPNAARPRISVKSAFRLDNLFGSAASLFRTAPPAPAPAPACVEVVTPADGGTSGASKITGGGGTAVAKTEPSSAAPSGSGCRRADTSNISTTTWGSVRKTRDSDSGSETESEKVRISTKISSTLSDRSSASATSREQSDRIAQGTTTTLTTSFGVGGMSTSFSFQPISMFGFTSTSSSVPTLALQTETSRLEPSRELYSRRVRTQTRTEGWCAKSDCREPFFSWKSYVEHFKENHVHGRKHPSFYCPHCLAYCGSAEPFAYHLLKHDIYTDHDCGRCSARFIYKIDLDNHWDEVH